LNFAGRGRGEAKRAEEEQPEDSITRLLGGLKRGEEVAAQGLWQRYFEKLVRLARRKLNGMPRRMMDEEDVALSVFKSLCVRAKRGDFKQLDDRDDLWRLLATITHLKAAEAARGANRQKRSSRGRRELSIEQMAAAEPLPEMLASMNEQRERLLALLPDEACRKIAQWKLDGHTDEEVAVRLQVTDRTVRRKMKLIRAVWGDEIAMTQRE
jgi:DNA-directed RNA polymerase specialized sigma24 family protein